jgi:hypothetical protein
MTDTPPDIWTDIERAASFKSYSKDTFHQWKSRGYVPPSAHHDIVLGSVALGGSVTHPILHEMWKARTKPTDLY